MNYIAKTLFCCLLFSSTIHAGMGAADTDPPPTLNSNQQIEELQSQLKNLQAQHQLQMSAFNTQVQAQLKKMQTDLEYQIQALNTQTQNHMKQLETTLQKQIIQVQQEIKR